MFLANDAVSERLSIHVTDRPLILIADDDPAIRSFLHHALEREGFDTVLAANGREALDRIAEHGVRGLAVVGRQG